MSQSPLVSVVTATYNMAPYLAEAVDSVLGQDYPALELIVVDDGSTDRTPEVLRRYRDDPRVKVVRQENAGQTAAKNRGLREARGVYLGFCDADNRWLPGKLARQVPVLEADPALAVVYGDIQLIDDAGNVQPTPRVKRYSGRITGRLLADNFVTFNTALVPRRVLDEVGGFDETLTMAIDYDLWLRISVDHEFRHLPHDLVQYRIWGGQMSHRLGERFANSFRLLENFLARHPGVVSPAEVRGAYAHTYVSRGLWHAREKRRKEAWSDFHRAFRLRPLDRRLWRNLARILG